MIKWSAKEFIHYPKDLSWHLINIALAALFVLLALWQKNFLLVVLLVIAEILIIIWSIREPKEIDFEISETGLRIENNIKYPFNSLTCFDIQSGAEDLDELLILQKMKFRPIIKIPLPKEQSSQIKEYLLKYLPEKEIEESLLDSLSKLI